MGGTQFNLRGCPAHRCRGRHSRPGERLSHAHGCGLRSGGPGRHFADHDGCQSRAARIGNVLCSGNAGRPDRLLRRLDARGAGYRKGRNRSCACPPFRHACRLDQKGSGSGHFRALQAGGACGRDSYIQMLLEHRRGSVLCRAWIPCRRANGAHYAERYEASVHHDGLDGRREGRPSFLKKRSKKLLSLGAARGDQRPARHQAFKSLFASFSSEKEEPSFTPQQPGDRADRP